jgi:hypothetical protein
MDCNKPKLSKVRTNSRVGPYGYRESCCCKSIVFLEHVAVPTSGHVIFKNYLNKMYVFLKKFESSFPVFA